MIASYRRTVVKTLALAATAACMAGADDKNLASGDNVTQTQSAVVLENLISQFLYNSAAGNSPAGGKGASADK